MKSFYIYIVFFFILSCENKKEELKKIQEKTVILKKYSENKSVNDLGAFVVMHYFLLSNGNLEKVELEDYVRYEVNDSLIITYTYYE